MAEWFSSEFIARNVHVYVATCRNHILGVQFHSTLALPPPTKPLHPGGKLLDGDETRLFGSQFSAQVGPAMFRRRLAAQVLEGQTASAETDGSGSPVAGTTVAPVEVVSHGAKGEVEQ